MRLKRIDQQVVVIVGATSGIGREAALRFAERGAKVVAAGRSLPELESLVEDIRSTGGEAIAVPVEVTDLSQVQALAQRAIEAYGRIDTWVHGAAVMVSAKFTDTTPEEFRRVIDVNLMGQVYGAMAALPHLKNEGRGALIHISSVEAHRAMPFHSAYAASQYGMVGFMDALRLELQHEGWPISVTEVAPSSVNTPLFEKALTRLGVKPRPHPPVYEPGVVVGALLYAAEHRVRHMVVGGAGNALIMAHKLSPRLADTFLRVTAFKGQRTDEPKPATAPNNLYQHMGGYGRSRANIAARPFSVYTWMQTHPAGRWAVVAPVLVAGSLLAVRPPSRLAGGIARTAQGAASWFVALPMVASMRRPRRRRLPVISRLKLPTLPIGLSTRSRGWRWPTMPRLRWPWY